MGLKERSYSVLLVSSSGKMNEALLPLFPDAACDVVKTVPDVSAAKRAFADRAYDFVIVNSPLPDDPGIRFAIDVSASAGSVALMLVRSELYGEMTERVTESGVFTLAKPTSRQMILIALNWMSGVRERLRKTEKKTLSVEEKMEEIRIVNRAKWLLIDRQGMTEADAHRYIEKQAMDLCFTRRAVAEEIIDRLG